MRDDFSLIQKAPVIINEGCDYLLARAFIGARRVGINTPAKRTIENAQVA